MSKPREFWIAEPIFGSTVRGGGFIEYRCFSDEMEKPKTSIHVIEYSAYEQMKADVEYWQRRAADAESGDCDSRIFKELSPKIRELQAKLDEAVKALDEIYKAGQEGDETTAECNVVGLAEIALKRIRGQK